MGVHMRRGSLARTMLVAAGLVVTAMSVPAPARSEVTVASVAVNDGMITITGGNFGASPSVTLGGASLTIVSNSGSEIVAELPALDAGIYELVVSGGAEAGAEGAVRTIVTIQ